MVYAHKVSSNVAPLVAEKIQHRTSKITENVEASVFITHKPVMVYAHKVSSDVEKTPADKIQPTM